jgi:hypothetical protein
VCRKCNTPKTHQEFPKDKTGKFGISAWCKSCYYKHNAEYQKNPKNKEKLHIMQKKQRNLYKNNLNYVIKQRLRHRMWTVLKGNPKAGHTLELLGCSIQQFKSHLALRFQVGMTWENYGKYGWHIDHIRPCSSFDLSQPEEQRKCFHYTNLQPLWAKDNLSKKDKWDKINYAAR